MLILLVLACFVLPILLFVILEAWPKRNYAYLLNLYRHLSLSNIFIYNKSWGRNQYPKTGLYVLHLPYRGCPTRCYWTTHDILTLMVAGAGLEPTTFRLWAWQATNCSTPQGIFLYFYFTYITYIKTTLNLRILLNFFYLYGGAGEIRTHAHGVADRCLTTWLLRLYIWSSRVDLNHWPMPYQDTALPLSYWRICGSFYEIRTHITGFVVLRSNPLA